MAAVDVIVVSYNSRLHLRSCLEPLSRTEQLRVVVVDNGSSDGTLETIADLAIDSVPLNDNRGFAHACNVGWRMTTAPYLLFLNPDASIDPESIERLVEVAQEPSVGAVAPKIVEADGSLDFSMRRFPRLRSTWAQALFVHRVFPHSNWSDELVRDVDAYARSGKPEWASGACLLIRRDVLEQVGGWDDGFFLYCEDIDLCRRIRDAGLDLRYEPRATVAHKGGASAPRAALLPVLAASRVRYARKHNTPVAAFLEQAGIALGSLTHVIICRGGRSQRLGYLKAFGAALRRP